LRKQSEKCHLPNIIQFAQIRRSPYLLKFDQATNEKLLQKLSGLITTVHPRMFCFVDYTVKTNAIINLDIYSTLSSLLRGLKIIKVLTSNQSMYALTFSKCKRIVVYSMTAYQRYVRLSLQDQAKLSKSLTSSRCKKVT